MSSLSVNRKITVTLNKFSHYRKNIFANKSCASRTLVLRKKQEPKNVELKESDTEPPILSQAEHDQVLRYKRQKQEIAFNLTECEVHLDGIKHGLFKTKTEIESIRTSQQKMLAQINTTTSTGEVVALNEKQLQLQRRLILLVDVEEKLMSSLEAQRRGLAESRIKDQTFTLDMENKIDSIYKLYETREKFNYKRRLQKDQMIKKNMSLKRSKALKSWASSIQNQVQQQQREDAGLTSTPNEETKKRKAPNEKIQQYIRFTNAKKRTEKLLTNADMVMRQSHQYSNLITLRNRIYNQKDVLWAESKIRQKKAKKKKEMEEKVKRAMIEAGENPYISEKIMKVTQKQKLIEKYTLEAKKVAIKKISEEYENEEKQKLKKEMRRRKWTKFWNNLSKEKRRGLKAKNERFFAAVTETIKSKTADEAANTALTTASDYFNNDGFNLDLLFAEKGIPPPPPNTMETEIIAEADTEIPEAIQAELSQEKYHRKKTLIRADNETSSKEKIGKASPHLEENRKVSVTGSNELTKGEIREKSVLSVSHIDEGAAAEIQKEPKEKKRNSVFGSISGGKAEGEIVANNVEILPEENKGSGEPFAHHMRPNLPDDNQIPISKEGKLAGLPIFRWNPEIITFKNFIIGKTYKKKVTVTNLSLQIVKFYFKGLTNIDLNPEVPETTKTVTRKSSSKKLKSGPKVSRGRKAIITESDLQAEKVYQITDLVQVDFKIPKPLSPGISHTFTVTFKTDTQGDWKGKLCFESEHGNFFILIQCLKTRLIPTLTPSRVKFHNVVVETSTSTTVKLQNVGEKPGTILRLHKRHDYSPLASLIDLTVDESIMSVVSISTQPGKDIRRFDHDQEYKTSHAHGKEHHQQQHEQKSGRKIPLTVPVSAKSSKGVVALSLPKAIKTFIEDLLTLVTESTFVAYIQENQRKLEAGEFVHLKIHFHPFHIGSFFTSYDVQFDDVEVEVLRLEIEGNGIENPLTLEPQHTNMKICLLGFNYQQPILIKNSSKYAGKVVSYILPALRQVVSIYPKDAQLLSKHSTQFSVKFHPNVQMLTQPGINEFYDSDTLIMDFPVYFDLHFPMTMPGPLECTFLAVISESVVRVTPTEIDFGTCLTTETVKATISIFNPCFVPQHIGFVDVPEHITVQPNNGFGTILPSETREFDILLSMTNELEGERQFQIKVQSLEKVEQTITLRVSVKSFEVSLSHSRICFPVTCCGSVSSSIIEIFSTAAPFKIRGNDAKTLLNRFEFLLDESYPIKIKPKSGFLEPGKAAKILVEFLPNITEDEIKNNYVNIMKIQRDENMNNLHKELDGINEALAAVLAEEAASVGNTKLSGSVGSGKSQQRKKTSIIGIGDSKIIRKGKNRKRSTVKGVSSLITKPQDDTLDIEEDEGTPNTREALERRQIKLVKLLEEQGNEFTPPDFSNVSMNTLEIAKAKRDLIHSLTPRSQAYTIPCLVTDPSGVENTLLLNVKCPMQKPDLILLDDTSNVIDFDKVALGAKRIKEVNLYNVSPGHLTLRMDIINPYGPFQRVNALRKIAPGQVFTLKLKFLSTEEGYFEDSIVICGGESRLGLILAGTSLKPKFRLDPSQNENFVGNTKIGKLVIYKLEIQNESDIDLDFEIEGADGGNYDGPELPNIQASSIAQDNNKFGRRSVVIVSPEERPTTPKKTGRRASRESKKNPDVSNVPEVPVLDSAKHKRKNSTQSSTLAHQTLGTGRSSRDRVASLNNIPFEIMDGNVKKLANFKDLTYILERDEQPAFFGSYPQNLKIFARQSESFDIGFLPMVAGRYFRIFNLKLNGRIVQSFSAVGVGFDRASITNVN